MSIVTGALADGESLEFTSRGLDAVLGFGQFQVNVVSINGHTLTLQKESDDTWHNTGDNFTEVGSYTSENIAVTSKYRVLASGGTGDAKVEVDYL